MDVFIVTAVPPRVRGALSKWTVEPAPGVFVGDLSARVRDQIWEWLEEDRGSGTALLISSAGTEVGYSIRSRGVQDRRLVEFDGLQLFARRYLRDKKVTTVSELT